MPPPRRTPFYGEAREELAQVHTRFYAARDDTRALEQGVSIVRLWMNRGACPQAVEASALLVQGILADRTGVPSIGTRSTYAMALVRFVNGVADSFQTRLYAQPIAAIAERVGLPQWLVQVRHMATHEDMPSLAVCREATTLALDWLNCCFWQPRLHPGAAAETAAAAEGNAIADERRACEAAAARLAQLLHVYRTCAQDVARDRSLTQRAGKPLPRAAADVERWVHAESERRIVCSQRADAQAYLGREAHSHGVEGELDSAPRAADTHALSCAGAVLMTLVAHLLLRGALMPQRREGRKGSSAHVLPEVLAADAEAWDPLLTLLCERFPLFPSLLVQALARVVAGVRQTDDAMGTAAAAWLLHLATSETYAQVHVPGDVPRWPLPNEVTATDAAAASVGFETLPPSEASSGLPNTGMPLWRTVVQVCLEEACDRYGTPGVELCANDRNLAIAEHVASQSPALAERVHLLAELRGKRGQVAMPAGTSKPRASAPEESGVVSNALSEMEEREKILRGIEPALDQEVQEIMPMPEQNMAEPSPPAETELPGWRRTTSWTPTPIGCLQGYMPPLVLDG